MRKPYSSHGYDTIDYFSIDPRFGHEADLHILVREAHRHGLRVILDLALNHTSTDFPLFSSALQNEASPYRQWLSFDPLYRHGYRTFFGVASMPQIDLDYPDARAYMLDVGRYWLREFDVDGYRLDYAAGPSHGFWSAFRAACRSTKPDCWIFGEVTRTGERLRTYVGRLDGCLDFAFGRDVRRFCATVEPSFGIGQFAQSLIRRRRFFGADFVLPTFLDNHDMNRFLWVVENDKERLKLAAGLLFAFGGTPIIYYGTEVGLSQPRPKAPYREESRHPMPWDEGQDVELLAFFRAWIGSRKRHPALNYGDLSTHLLDEERGIWLVERCYAGDRVLVIVNCAGVGHAIALPEGDYMAADGRPVSDSFDCPLRSVTALSRPLSVSADVVDDIID